MTVQPATGFQVASVHSIEVVAIGVPMLGTWAMDRRNGARRSCGGDEFRMTLYTIGFTQSSAESFFGRLTGAGVRTVIDVRLNNTSQLAGFAKARDLPYLLRAIGGI